MKITWLGHSCFKIESKNGSIILDPYADGKVTGLKPLRESANMVLCSHEHADHNAREVITIKDGETPFHITYIDTYHDDQQGTLRGKNRIHILDDGEFTIAHLGDLGCALTGEQIEQLKNVDVLLVPVGGYYTIDASQAKEIVNQIQPEIVIPMHYRGDGFGYDVLASVDQFTQYFDQVLIKEDNVIDVKENLGNSVIVLSY
ncbi:MAG: MBL fold metallo-hydrolase [Firmicutes bacterium]|nr:MBL fold metallo-hydrolase [Bacillota bacterium]